MKPVSSILRWFPKPMIRWHLEGYPVRHRWYSSRLAHNMGCALNICLGNAFLHLANIAPWQHRHTPIIWGTKLTDTWHFDITMFWLYCRHSHTQAVDIKEAINIIKQSKTKLFASYIILIISIPLNSMTHFECQAEKNLSHILLFCFFLSSLITFG